MNLEIIIVRDPDGDTALTYFLNGERVSANSLGVAEYHVDPGRSGGDEEWVRSMTEIAQDASPACRDRLLDHIEAWKGWSH